MEPGDKGKPSGGVTAGLPRRKSRVLSGMRPTGRLHIGHYFGALQNWVRLQSDPSYECFYFIADWHALTSDYADTSAVVQNTIEIMIDYLAAGLDPVGHENCVIFLQSLIPEHAELHLLLSMVTPLGWLERVPTYKEALENVKDRDLHTYGFLGYPVLQTADIVIYGQPGMALVVPVGEDQVSHVEISREIVRRFNLANAELQLPDLPDATWSGLITEVGIFDARIAETLIDDTYAGRIDRVKRELLRVYRSAPLDEKASYLNNRIGVLRPLLIEPQHQLTPTPRIPGLDGRKMSKSYGNAITLSESDADIRAKTKVMVTDPARKRRTDPGEPDKCPVYDWHKLFSAGEKGRLEWVQTGCRSAGIGCIECKKAMADNLIMWIAPIRERRVKWENDQKGVLEIIDEGSSKARVVAQGTMERVREAVFGWGKKRKVVTSGGKKVASGE